VTFSISRRTSGSLYSVRAVGCSGRIVLVLSILFVAGGVYAYGLAAVCVAEADKIIAEMTPESS